MEKLSSPRARRILCHGFSVESQTAEETSSYRSSEEDPLQSNTEQKIVIQHASCVFICDLFMALDSSVSVLREWCQ